MAYSLSHLSLQYKGKCKRQITDYHIHSRTFSLYIPEKMWIQLIFFFESFAFHFMFFVVWVITDI